MTIAALASLEQRIREAVASGAYRQSQELFGSYVALVARTLAETGPGDATALELAERTRELFGWAHRMVLAARAHLSADLNRVAATTPYRRQLPARIPTWHLDA